MQLKLSGDCLHPGQLERGGSMMLHGNLMTGLMTRLAVLWLSGGMSNKSYQRIFNFLYNYQEIGIK